MFDLSWGKLVIIGVVALLVIGPKELPGVLRTLGQYMAKIRRMAAEFQGQFQDAMREAEMADLKKQFDDTTSAIKSAVDPSGIKSDIEKMIQDPLGDIPKPAEGTTTTEVGKATDPVALGTAPVAPPAASEPAAPVPAVDVSVPMPELPPPVTSADIAAASPPPAQEPAAPPPAAPAEGGKAA